MFDLIFGTRRLYNNVWKSFKPSYHFLYHMTLYRKCLLSLVWILVCNSDTYLTMSPLFLGPSHTDFCIVLTLNKLASTMIFIKCQFHYIYKTLFFWYVSGELPLLFLWLFFHSSFLQRIHFRPPIRPFPIIEICNFVLFCLLITVTAVILYFSYDYLIGLPSIPCWLGTEGAPRR